jgi:hypothetical protein
MIAFFLIAGGAYLIYDSFGSYGDGGLLIGDVAEIKTDFPEADFWLQRKGSEKTIGKPIREYYSENIGIKVKKEYLDKVFPDYLYYAFTYLYQKGVFQPMAVGSLSLKNLRVSDVRAIPIMKEGGVVYKDKELLQKYKSGKNIGFSAVAHLKAKGLIPRSHGKKEVSEKYK